MSSLYREVRKRKEKTNCQCDLNPDEGYEAGVLPPNGHFCVFLNGVFLNWCIVKGQILDVKQWY